MIEVKKGDGKMLVERMAKLWEIEEAKNIGFAVVAMRNEEPLWWHDDTSKLLKNDPATWKSMIDGMVKAGLLKPDFTPDRVYTDEITNTNPANTRAVVKAPGDPMGQILQDANGMAT